MHDFTDDVKTLDPATLKSRWSQLWGLPPPPKISRKMLEDSLIFKLREQAGYGLTPAQQAKLAEMVKAYKRNAISGRPLRIKPGTRLVRTYRGQRYIVTVRANGFEYNGQLYASLSEAAYAVTGTRWNGWAFFGIKRRETT